MVAMRVVNSVEKELVEAEWESWVEDENRKCSRVESLLVEGTAGDAETYGEVKDKLEKYCSSCRSAKKLVVEAAR